MEGIYSKFKATSISVPSTSFSSISWDTDLMSNSNIIRIDSSSNIRFQLPEGRYLIHFHLRADQSANFRCNLQTRLEVEYSDSRAIFFVSSGYIIKGSYGSGYLRDTSNDQATCDSWAIFDSNGQDFIVPKYRSDDNINATINSTETYIEFIKLDSTKNFAHYSDENDTNLLADTTGGTFSVSWDKAIRTNSDISISGSNDEVITLGATNSKYLIICNVNYNSSNGIRTSRSIFPTINGDIVEGVIGDEYGRNSSNEYASPNFLFIHETGDTADDMIIWSKGPAYDEYIGGAFPVISTGNLNREIDTSGIFILELDDNFKYYKGQATSFNQNISSTSNVTLNVYQDDLVNNNTICTPEPSSTAIIVQKKMRAFIYSQIYIQYVNSVIGSNSTRLTRKLTITVNGTEINDGGIAYVRGFSGSQDVIQATYQTSAVIDLNAGDIIRIVSKDDGFTDGTNIDTISDFPPTIFIIDLTSLRPKLENVSVSTLSTNSGYLRDQYTTPATPFNRGMGSWAGEMAGSAFLYDDYGFGNTLLNQSLLGMQNYYTRFGENIMKRYIDSNTINYYFIPYTGVYYFCFYDATEVYYYGLNGPENILIDSVSAPNVTAIINLNQGDVLTSTKPVTIYYSNDVDHFSALYSKWSGYNFMTPVGEDLINVSGLPTSTLGEIIIFTLDDQTDINIIYHNIDPGDQQLVASFSIYEAFTFTSSVIEEPTGFTISALEDYLGISSNKPIVCGYYDKELQVQEASPGTYPNDPFSYGFQLYPGHSSEILYGSFNGNYTGGITDIGIVNMNRNVFSRSANPSSFTSSVQSDNGNTLSLDDTYGDITKRYDITNLAANFSLASKIVPETDEIMFAHNIMNIDGETSSNSIAAFSSMAAGSTSFVFHMACSYITIISDTAANIQLYRANGLLIVSQSLVSNGNNVYKISLDGSLYDIDSGGVLTSDQPVQVWAIDKDTSKYQFYVHGTRYDNFSLSSPSLSSTSTGYNSSSQDPATDMCPDGPFGFPSKTIYHDQTTANASKYFYENSAGTIPLSSGGYIWEPTQDEYYWLEANGTRFLQATQSC
jgi:hypothetical protein